MTEDISGATKVFLVTIILSHTTAIFALNNCSYANPASTTKPWCKGLKKFYCIQIGSDDFMETCLDVYRIPPVQDEEMLVTINETSNETKNEGVYIGEYYLNGGTNLKTDEFLESAPTKLVKNAMVRGKIVWLWGMNGSGKTHAAKWYVMYSQKKCKGNAKVVTPKAWIIECKDMDRMFTTTKRVVDNLEIPFSRKIQSTEDDVEDCCNLLPNQILKDKDFEHLFIFDQVDKDRMGLVEKLITILGACSNVRCIITSEKEPRETFYHSKERVDGFDENDSVRFLTGFGAKPELIEFAKSMDHSPYALKIAKEFMRSSRIKADSFWDCISLDEEQQLGNPLEKCLRPFRMHVEFLNENEKDVFKLLRYVQFLKSKEIPVYIFTFLLSDKKFKDANLMTNLFVQSMQNSALGFLEGEGKRRMLETHDFLKLIFRMYYSDYESNSQALYDLLKCFSWLFSRDQGHAIDHQRCIEILPHAEELLTNIVKTDYLKTAGLLPSLAYITTCTRMCYVYTSLGFISKPRKLSKEIVDFINTGLLSTKLCEVQRCGDNWDQYKKSKDAAQDISTKLEGILGLKKNFKDINVLALEYITNKHRVVHHIEFLVEALPSADKLARRVQLSKEELKILQEKKLALGEEQTDILTRIFLYEIVIYAFLQCGIMSTGKTGQRDDPHLPFFIEVAYQLSIILKEKCDSYDIHPYCALYTDLNGKIEHLLEKEDTNEVRLADLKDAEERLQKYIQEDICYCETGLIIVKSTDLDVQLYCHKQLLRVFVRLAEHDSCYNAKAHLVANKLKTLLTDKKDTIGKAYSSQSAKQTAASFYMKNKNYQAAVNLLEAVVHYNWKEPEFPPSQHDIRDVYLQCTGLANLKRRSYRDIISGVKKLKSMIPDECVAAHLELDTLDTIE